MGLSERKQKQRLVGSSQAKNTAWLEDTSLPGQRLLASMGWAPGSGLGAAKQGLATHLAASMKLDNKGIGAQRHEREAIQSGKADAWVGSSGDLGSLYERLNKANAAGEAAKGDDEESAAVLAKGADPARAAPVSRPVFSRLAYVFLRVPPLTTDIAQNFAARRRRSARTRRV